MLSERQPRIGAPHLARFDDHERRRTLIATREEPERVGQALDQIEGAIVLHDRIVPGSARATIDHVVVTPVRVYVVESMRCSGPITVGRTSLTIRGHDRTRLVDVVRSKTESVRSYVEADLALQGRLCFVDGEFSVLSRTNCRRVEVTNIRALVRAVTRDVTAAPAIVPMETIALRLDRHLRPAF